MMQQADLSDEGVKSGKWHVVILYILNVLNDTYAPENWR